MKTAVLDASLTLAWYFPDESSGAAEAVLEELEGGRLLVPAIWQTEIANGLVVGTRRRRVPAGSREEFVSLLVQLRIETQIEPFPDHLGRVMAVAEQHGLTAYDAAYLELALGHGTVLASLDAQLRRAAHRAGLALLPAGRP